MHHYHTEIADEMYGKHKDLRMLFDIFQLQNMSKHNTVIIDDHQKVYKANGINAIRAPAFLVMDETHKVAYPDSLNDTFFIDVIDILEKLKDNYNRNGSLD